MLPCFVKYKSFQRKLRILNSCDKDILLDKFSSKWSSFHLSFHREDIPTPQRLTKTVIQVDLACFKRITRIGALWIACTLSEAILVYLDLLMANPNIYRICEWSTVSLELLPVSPPTIFLAVVKPREIFLVTTLCLSDKYMYMYSMQRSRGLPWPS